MCHRLSFVGLLLVLLVSASPADAQIWNRVKRAAQRGAERAVERETERRAERATTNAIECVLGDDACAERARENGQEVTYVDEDGTPAAAGAAPGVGGAASPNARPGEGAWANYDFVPGARVLLYEDFEREYVGNVPRRFAFESGVMEVVSESGNQMLRFASASSIALPLPETLPERFTIEFDLYHGDDWNYTVLGTGPLDDSGKAYSTFHGDLRNHSAAEFRVGSTFKTGVHSERGGSSLQGQSAHEQAMVPIRIAVDGSYVKMYVGETRVANVPNADVQRTDRILWTVAGEIGAEDDGHVGPILVDNIRVAAGGREILYDRLVADGRVATHGILFGTGSARIRPESTPTLQDLGRTLQQHGDLRIRIEGHTDDTGSAETNQRLSQQRAEAVRTWLISEGIDGARLEAAGLGQARPTADNGTAEGRQQNRRVELVRL